MPDFIAAHHGSILTLTPMTAAAHEWVAAYLPEDAPRLGRSIAVEPRYWASICEGIEADNLTIN